MNTRAVFFFQTAVAHLAEAPPALDHMEDMLDVGTGLGAQAIDALLMRGQRLVTVGSAVDAVADASGLSTMTVRLTLVGLITKHFPLPLTQELGHLDAVVHVCRRSGRPVHDAAAAGTYVHLHPKVPILALLGPEHLRVASAFGVPRRRSRRYWSHRQSRRT